MGKQALRRGFTGDRQLDEAQRETAKTARRANANPFFDGNRVTGLVFVAATPLVIDHGLSRAPQGVIVLRSYGLNAAPPPRESATQPADLTRQITLQTTASATFDLWFW